MWQPHDATTGSGPSPDHLRTFSGLSYGRSHWCGFTFNVTGAVKVFSSLDLSLFQLVKHTRFVSSCVVWFSFVTSLMIVAHDDAHAV